VQAEAYRLCALDLPSFAETKARINERALHAIHAAVNDELGSVSTRSELPAPGAQATGDGRLPR